MSVPAATGSPMIAAMVSRRSALNASVSLWPVSLGLKRGASPGGVRAMSIPMRPSTIGARRALAIASRAGMETEAPPATSWTTRMSAPSVA